MALAKTSLPPFAADPLSRQSIPAGASKVHVLTLRLKRLLDADINHILNKHSDLSLPEWRILSLLSRNPEAMSQKELVGKLMIAQGQASRALFALQTEGLVLASQSMKDRRSWSYTMSEQGRDLFLTLLPHMEERREALEGGLSQEELLQFERIVSKVADAAHGRLQEH